MTTTLRDTPPEPAQLQLIREFRFWLPGWVRRQPAWLRITEILLILIAASLWVRYHNIGGQYWIDEGITVGISSHSLTSIPGILRVDGSPPLYYMLLHIWMSMVGNGEAATHWLSVIFATLTIPLGFWAGETIGGSRRAALTSATLFAFNAFLDNYSGETRMYALMTVFGLLATIGFVRGFVFRERKYVVLFGVSQALMFYTHDWSVYFAAGSFLSLCILYYTGDAQIRENLIRDVIAAFVGAVILFIPWIPNAFFQAIHTAAPWDAKPRFGAPIQIAASVYGGGSITVALLVGAGIGYSPLFAKPRHLSRESRVLMMLFAIPILTFVCAWLGSQITPAWVVRYFAPVVAPLVLLLSIGVARAGLIGAIVMVFCIWFMLRPGPFEPGYKSDMQDVAAEMAPMMHPGDLVIVGQPEASALAYYYLPGGLRWANTIGPVKDPTYLNWVNALKRYKAENVSKTVNADIASLKPGQQLLYIRPLTEGVANWSAPWTLEIRRKSAIYARIIADSKQLRAEAWAPHNYVGACCVADSAVLYKKVK